MELQINSMSELVKAANVENSRISDITLMSQCLDLEKDKEEVYQKMVDALNVMRESVEFGLKDNLRSASNLTGGEATKLRAYAMSGKGITGGIMPFALMRAAAVSECNAAMGRIVAAPTAGSCGILPAAVLTYQDSIGCSDDDCVMALFTASAIGMVIAKNASISGAEGGCQAECGSASAMAAGALVELAGGSPDMIEAAVAIALKNILGLVCDPVGGLVEIPCVKRNISGVMNAYAAAEMALAGMKSHIPADEVIVAMKRVGNAMHSSLKETAEGGLAITPTGIKLNTQLYGK